MSNTVLKSLIAERISVYLQESAESYSIIDSIFEEVSDETWEAIEEAIINELSEETLELYLEGTLKKGTPERAMKDAYRRGEAKTRDFYSGKNTVAKFKAPKTPAEKKAQKAGEYSNQGSPAAAGERRSTSQDSLKGTKHDQSEVTPSSKSFRSTHAQKQYGIRSVSPKLPK